MKFYQDVHVDTEETISLPTFWKSRASIWIRIFFERFFNTVR